MNRPGKPQIILIDGVRLGSVGAVNYNSADVNVQVTGGVASIIFASAGGAMVSAAFFSATEAYGSSAIAFASATYASALADSAFASATIAFSMADVAFNSATVALNSASTTFGIANVAFTSATIAQQAADTAQQSATLAFSSASQAQTTASAAFTSASLAFASASAAAISSSQIQATASLAFSSATIAFTSASLAQTAASGAQVSASNALLSADAAFASASVALESSSLVYQENRSRSPYVDAFTSFDTNDWTLNVTGTLSILTGAGYAGGNALQTIGHTWLISKYNIPYDPTRLYKFRARWKQTIDDPGKMTVYHGFSGIDATGSLCNILGTGGNSNQHYARSAAISATMGWVETIGYYRGFGATTGTSTGASITAPNVAHPNVRWMRPMFITNYNGGVGTCYLDVLEVTEETTAADGYISATNASSSAAIARTSATIAFTTASAAFVTATNAFSTGSAAFTTSTWAFNSASTISSSLSSKANTNLANITAMIGGGNLISNSSFENFSGVTGTNGLADGWLYINDVVSQSIHPSGVFGGYCQYFVCSGSTGNAGIYSDAASSGSWVPSGTQVVLSWYASCSSGINLYPVIKGWTQALGYSAMSIGNPAVTKQNNTWERVSSTFTTTADSYISAQPRTIAAPSGTKIWFDAVQLEIGTIATAYAPKTDEILPGTVGTHHLTASAVTTEKIAANAIVASKIAANQISGSHIIAGEITTALISASAITAGLIAASAVQTTHISASTIQGTHIKAATISGTHISAGTISGTHIAALTISGTHISAGTISGTHIAASTISGTHISAGTISGSNIAAGTISGTHIQASTISGTHIRASTISGTHIAFGTLSGSHLSAGTISGTHIAAQTISGTNIAASTISGDHIQARTINTNNIKVGGIGLCLNDDPWAQDTTAWTAAQGFSLLTGVTDISGASTAISNIIGTNSEFRTVRDTPIDRTKNYRLEMTVKRISGSGGDTNYLMIVWVDATGTFIQSNVANPAGWSNGTYSYYGITNSAAPTTWTTYGISFGPNETAQIPNEARFVRIGALANYNSSAGSQIGFTNFRLVEKTTGFLLVNGTISGSHIAADTISGTHIRASTISGTHISFGTLSGSHIAAGTISGTNIAASTISGTHISFGTLSGSHIAAGTISGTHIAALTISGTHISAGTISGSHIAAGTISGTHIKASTISGTHISFGTLSGSHISAGTISGTNIAIGTISGTNIAAGTIDANHISANGFQLTSYAEDGSGNPTSGVKIYNAAAGSASIKSGPGGMTVGDGSGTSYNMDVVAVKAAQSVAAPSGFGLAGGFYRGESRGTPTIYDATNGDRITITQHGGWYDSTINSTYAKWDVTLQPKSSSDAFDALRYLEVNVWYGTTIAGASSMGTVYAPIPDRKYQTGTITDANNSIKMTVQFTDIGNGQHVYGTSPWNWTGYLRVRLHNVYGYSAQRDFSSSNTAGGVMGPGAYDLGGGGTGGGGSGGACVAPETLVLVRGQNLTPIPVEISTVRPGDNVWTIPESGGELGYHEVENVHHTQNSCVKIRTSDGRELICSLGHLMMVDDTWIRAGDIRPGQKILGTPPGVVESVEFLGIRPVVQISVPTARTFRTSDGLWCHNTYKN